jgi:hypothetical protein
VQQPHGPLQPLFRSRCDIQNDGAMQHAGNLDRIADMGGLIAGWVRFPIGGDNNAAPFAQRTLRHGTKMAQVT